MAKSKVAAVSRINAAQERRWQAENDLRTIQSYAELKGSPQRLKAVEQILKEAQTAVSKVKPK